MTDSSAALRILVSLADRGEDLCKFKQIFQQTYMNERLLGAYTSDLEI